MSKPPKDHRLEPEIIEQAEACSAFLMKLPTNTRVLNLPVFSQGLGPVRTEALPALTPEDLAILIAIEEDSPFSVLQQEIATRCRLSSKTVGKRLKVLRGHALTEPQSRKGERLTAKGQQILNNR